MRTSPPAPDESGRLPRRAGVYAVVVVAAGIGLVVAQGLASVVGDWARRGALVSVRTDPAGSVPRYSDATAGAAAFFAERDTVAVHIPYDMTVEHFLSLYHQVNNAGARRALREQLGAANDSDWLRAGDRVTVPLTVSGGSQ